MLIQLPPHQRPAVQVPTALTSLTADSAYVYDCGRTLYVWAGPAALRVTQARAADLANRIRKEDRGGLATVVFVNDAYALPAVERSLCAGRNSMS